MRYAERIIQAAAQRLRESSAGGPRSRVAGGVAGTTRSRGSATLQALRDLRAFVVKDSGLARKTDGTTEIPRHARDDDANVAQSCPVKPSQTQSCLVVPSPTINFPQEGVADTAYSGLIRPNTALNCFMNLEFVTKCQSDGPVSGRQAAERHGPAAREGGRSVDWLAWRRGTGTMGGQERSLRPRSSDGQSSGFLNRWSRVRLTPGAPL
jgi:hypothetical protein